jgi:hypothetical protein
MWKSFVIAMMVCGGAFSFGAHAWASGVHRIGVGVHYWTAVKDIDMKDVDQSGLSLIGSYQNQMVGFSTLELDLEVFGEGYAGADATVLSPQGYLLFGKGVYGGAGGGINYSDGSYSDPFFALRAGVDLEILPAVHLDINANYRFETWNFDRVKEDVKTGNVTLGAIVRLGLW